MAIERGENPIISDPIAFLSEPSGRVEVGVLGTKPTLEFLKFLPTLQQETGLVYIKEHGWAIVKTVGNRGVPATLMPNYSDVLLHSHPGETEFLLPSPLDVINCSLTAKNFIASRGGITQYFGTDRFTKKQLLWLQRHMSEENPELDDIYLNYEYLEKVGVRYNFTSWDELDEERLDTLLYKGIN